MAQPDQISDRIRTSYVEDPLATGTSREKVYALIDPSQLPLPVDTSGVGATDAQKIMTAEDKVEDYTWLDWNSRKLRRVSTIEYTAASITLTGVVTDTFSYTLLAGEYRLDSITRSYTP